MNFDQALAAFMAAIDNDFKTIATGRFKTLKWSDDPDDTEAYFHPVFIQGGRKYIKLAHRNGSQTMVYCFVERETGRILKAEGWKKPSLLDRVNPYNGQLFNVFDPDSYKNVDKSGTGWLYKI